ncbi:hypothetical protein FAM4067_01698 [Lacticaseibacillus paracasei]|nr:hypothetical protein FAM4067_01698 [Lacticaseibacillus paracasei]
MDYRLFYNSRFNIGLQINYLSLYYYDACIEAVNLCV